MIRLSTQATLLLATAFLAGQPAVAALVIDGSTPYTQDFDFLSTSSGVAWVDDQVTESTTGSPGWLWQSDGADQPYDASAGGNSTGSPYSYGEISADDRAIGNLGGGDNDNTAWGFVVQNGAPGALTSVSVGFTAEQWRTPTSSPSNADEVRFSYRVSTSETTSLEIANGSVPAGWTEVSDLSFDVISTTGSGAVDGNSATFSEELLASFDVDVPVGGYLALRWYDGDQSGFDYGMAIDDLTVTFAAIPEPTAVLFGGLLTTALCATLGRRRAATRA